MSRKFSVVTTFNQSGYEKYGRRLLETFKANWPQEVSLMVYPEDCEITETAPNIVVRDLHSHSAELVQFKQRWKNDARARGEVPTGPPDRKGKRPGIGFKWDAIRFSHKVYSICHAAQNTDCDVLLWMDADMVCHTPISIQALEKFCPVDIDIGYLGRERKYSECGLYSMNLSSEQVKKFLEKFQWMYDNAEQGIFKLSEWHDSFVFDVVKDSMPLNLKNWSAGLIKGEGHPLINSEWGAYLDHLKGKRKDIGSSTRKDLLTTRPESYWSRVQ